MEPREFVAVNPQQARKVVVEGRGNRAGALASDAQPRIKRSDPTPQARSLKSAAFHPPSPA